MAYKELEAFKFARTILQKIDELKVPFKFSDEVEMLSMNIKSKQFKDDDDLMPLCYRCSHHNPLLNQNGNNCSNCGQAFVFCFASFEVLPLVEFELPGDLLDADALELLEQVPVNDKGLRNRKLPNPLGKSSKFQTASRLCRSTLGHSGSI
jgi:intraflagellar transport protein 122